MLHPTLRLRWERAKKAKWQLSMRARCVRCKRSTMAIFTTVWAICVNWMAAFIFPKGMAGLSISSLPRDRASTGQRPLLLNWGILFSYYLHYCNYCNYWTCFSFFTQIFLLPSSGQGHLSFPGQAFRHAVMASHWRSQPGRTAECWSRSVSHVLCTWCLACAWLCVVFNIFRLSSKGAVSKTMFVINKNIVHLVDDNFWNFLESDSKRNRRESRYYWVYFKYCNYCYYCAYCGYWQLRCDLGIPDHVWTDKRAAFAKKVEDLGDQFRPAMRAGWLAYITKTYPKNAVSAGPALGEGELVVADEDAWLLSAPGSCLFRAINTQPNHNSVLHNNHNNR